MDAWEIDEIVDCAGDEEYFIRTHFKTHNPFKGLSTIDIVGKQAHILKRIQGKQCILDRVEERQIGMSTILVAHALWLALFKPSQRIVFLSKTYDQANNLRCLIDVAMAELPYFLRPKIKTNHKHSLEFDNGSWLHFANSNPDHLRGFATTLLIFDTFEYFGRDTQIVFRRHIDTQKLDTVDLLVV